MSNRPFAFPTYLGLPPNMVPLGLWGFPSRDDTFQDPAYQERAFKIAPDQLFGAAGIAFQGDWQNFVGSAALIANPTPPAAPNLRPILSIAFPAFPDSVSGTMTLAASGSYTSEWQEAITPLAAAFPGAVYRFCPEFDGDWFPFSYGQAGAGQATYAHDFATAIGLFSTTLLAIDPTAKVCFNPNYTASNRMPSGLWQSCLPASGVGVHTLGVDIYDNSQDNDPNCINRWFNTVQPTLNDLSALSLLTNLPIAVPEFGPGYCNGPTNPTPDNPYWFRLLYGYMSQNNMSYLVIWNANGNSDMMWGSAMRIEANRLFSRYDD